jgi:hypothetical protein
VPFNGQHLHFANLDEGSTFAVYSPFGMDSQQNLSFRAVTSCIIYKLSVTEDLPAMAKTNNQISLLIKTMRAKVQGGISTEFDFFRRMRPLDVA